MLRRKFAKALNEIPIEIQRLRKNKYPRFVTTSINRFFVDEVPVFMFHSVTAAQFEFQLRYLKENQYETLTLKQFMAFLSGAFSPINPSVLLTFDDGDKSWYEVAYPLLQKYDYHAVGFLVPSYICEETSLDSAWMSWDEVREIESSGVMEMESHTFHHARVFTGRQVIDFYHPQYNFNPLNLDIPWVMRGDQFHNQLDWGTPIYQHESLYAGSVRYCDDEVIREKCVAWVKRQGGVKFFNEANWQKKIQAFYKSLDAELTNQVPRYESSEDRDAAIYSDLLKAKHTLEEKLQKRISHLCYPWGAGSEKAVNLSRQAGYESNFWVVNNVRNCNRQGDSPFYNSRLKDDYLVRLPGQGRQPLSKIFTMKISRRFQKTNIY
ncbi:MAG: hypothetical protein DWQ04_28155 [Chloroflexi bacterium]|nr:MAG: hypothetical protein DWQ04_28155 [Chloroflexota bacterium]